MPEDLYHLEFKHKGKWHPAYASFRGKEEAQKGMKGAKEETIADTGKPGKWRIASGRSPAIPPIAWKIALSQWFVVATLVGTGIYFLTRKD